MQKTDKKPIIFIFILLIIFMLSMLHKQYLNAHTELSFYEYILLGEDAQKYENTAKNDYIEY